ncbi:hypothetical protein RRG08_003918 [Elysia crispata]|uniref:Uncharacterized protein n=1 Tax=Elysia crispata TaxID=231223 RepID=A0AAE0YTK9_9GAST|nr:hypothetical protein RRG08_003918 [Elysia crispata]
MRPARPDSSGLEQHAKTQLINLCRSGVSGCSLWHENQISHGDDLRNRILWIPSSRPANLTGWFTWL